MLCSVVFPNHVCLDFFSASKPKIPYIAPSLMNNEGLKYSARRGLSKVTKLPYSWIRLFK